MTTVDVTTVEENARRAGLATLNGAVEHLEEEHAELVAELKAIKAGRVTWGSGKPFTPTQKTRQEASVAAQVVMLEKMLTALRALR
jgi:hypothetical protein